MLEKDIAPLVLGKTYPTPEAMFHDLSTRTLIRAVQCGETGPFAQVIAGLDTALWDLAARQAGMPLRKLIRSDAPDSVPTYASGIHISAAAELVPASRLVGHRRFKLKVGFGMESDVALLREVSDGLGDTEALSCDANQAWSLAEAKDFLDRVQKISMLWLEEPVPVFANSRTWKELAEYADMPLAGGENLSGHAAFTDAISKGYLGVIQPDVAKWGGISGCLKVANEALSAGLRYCPHFLGAGIGLAASAELLAASGGDGLLELDVNANPLRSGFFGDVEPVSDGAWHCSERAGLGIDSIPETLKQFETLHIDVHA